jgi:signal peptidase I
MRFSEILVIATFITGIIWAIDALFFRHKRMMNVVGGSRYTTHKEPWWVDYSRAFFPILLIVLILRSFLAEPFRIPSGSMRPTLLEGDFIVVNKYVYGLRLPILGTEIVPIGSPKRGDVIVFKHEKKGESIDMIKRVVGMPGDHVVYKDKIVYINNEPVKQEFLDEKIDITPTQGLMPVRHLMEQLGEIRHQIYVNPTHEPMAHRYEHIDVVVPPDSYFVLGDNRDNSEDSRVWGFVKNKDIQGRAFEIWMSWDAAKNTVRWDRIMTKIQ